MAELEPWQEDALRQSAAVSRGVAPSAAAMEPWQQEAIGKAIHQGYGKGNASAEPTPLQWGAGEQTLHGLTEGLYAPALAAHRAANRFDTTPIAKRYAEERKKLQNAQDEYTRGNPLESGLLELGPSALGTAGALMLGGAAAEPGLARAAAAFPRVAEGLRSTAAGRLGSSVARGAVEGGASGLLQSNLGEGPVGEQIGAGAITGGVINPFANVLGSAFKSSITPRTAEVAQNVMGLGVPLRSANVPGAPKTAQAVGKFYGAHGDDLREAATRAVARTFGQDSPVVDYKTIQNAHHDLGQIYETLAPHLNIPGHDVDLHLGINNLRSDASKLETKVFEQVDKTLADLEGHLATGNISGEAFKTMKGPKGSLGVMLRSTDGTVRHFGQEIEGELQAAMERHSPPQYIDALRENNKKYKNLMIADALSDEATGIVDPGRLTKEVEKRYGTTATVRAGDLGTLAQAAELGMLKSAPKVVKREGSRSGGVAKPVALAALGTEAARELAPHAANLLSHIGGATELGLAAGGTAAAGGFAHGMYLQSPKGTANLLQAAQRGAGARFPNPLIPAAVGVVNERKLPEGDAR